MNPALLSGWRIRFIMGSKGGGACLHTWGTVGVHSSSAGVAGGGVKDAMSQNPWEILVAVGIGLTC